MGFRFRRSVKILIGLKTNFSRSGVSTSIGGRGAHVTVVHGVTPYGSQHSARIRSSPKGVSKES
jgi:hypothetical protein